MVFFKCSPEDRDSFLHINERKLLEVEKKFHFNKDFMIIANDTITMDLNETTPLISICELIKFFIFRKDYVNLYPNEDTHQYIVSKKQLNLTNG